MNGVFNAGRKRIENVFNVGKKRNLSDRKYVGNNPKFLNRKVLANSTDPDQTAPRGEV